MEKQLATAQRAHKKDRVKVIPAKIKHQRMNDQHQNITQLVNANTAFFVGNVSSSGLVKTNQAKSVLDAPWSLFKTMLEYKCQQAGIVFEEVNEAYTTVTCP